MKAAVMTAIGAPLEIEELVPRELGDLDVRVEIDASGVCHSDLAIVEGHTAAFVPPLMMGHEGTGIVVEVGGGVTRVRPGDRVIVSLRPACGTCWFCAHDESHLCDEVLSYGKAISAHRSDGTPLRALAAIGSFAELTTTTESQAVRIETDLPPEQLALLGCGVAVGVGAALHVARVSPGSTVAVIGCGGVGQSVIQGARVAGAARIIAIDPLLLKRDTALAFGATDVIDPGEADPIEQVRALTAGRGADVTFEVVGSAAIIRQAYDMTRRGGTVVVVGMARAGEEMSFPAAQFMGEGKRILANTYGGVQARRDLQQIVDLAENARLDLGKMVTKQIHLHDINAGLDALRDGSVIRSVMVRS